MHSYNERIVENQMGVLIAFAQSYAYFREIKEALNDERKSKYHLAYLVHLNDVMANDIIIKWCMVFGVNTNELHWKIACVEPNFHSQVKFQILSVFGGLETAWSKYHSDITSFRNTYSAHRNLDEFTPVPDFKIAFSIAEVYFNYLVNTYNNLASDQQYLQKYYLEQKNYTAKYL